MVSLIKSAPMLILVLLNCLSQSAQDFHNVVTAVLENEDVFEGLGKQENWVQRQAFIPAGNDVARKELTTLEKAKASCMRNVECKGICFPRPDGFPAPDEQINVDYKGNTNTHNHEDWWTLLKPMTEGILKNPKATSQAVLYALRSVQVMIRSLPITMGLVEKEEKINAIIEDVQQSILTYLRNTAEIEMVKKAIIRARTYLEDPLTQAYIDMIGVEPVALGDVHNGIGLTFLSNSVDVDSKKSLTLLDGVEMPRIGFGTWQLGGQIAYDSVISALRTGYRHIDTAQGYRNEKEVGRAISDFLAEEGSVKRSDLFITTKLSHGADFATGKTRKAILQQLEDLQLDYVDVYMIHGPQNREKNKEAWRDMEELFNEGKIKALGISNYDDWWLDDLLRYAKHRPVYLQNKFDIYTHGLQTQTGKSMLDRATKEGIKIAGYSTLNRWPLLVSPRDDPHVARIAWELGRTSSQVLLRWALQLGIAVIPRSANESHIKENFALYDFHLTNEQMHCINRIYLLSSTHDLEFVEPFPETTSSENMGPSHKEL